MADDVRVVAEALKAVTSEVVKSITLDVTANLIETTPVDTGWAKNNWVPNIGAPTETPVGTRDRVDPGAQQAGIASVATASELTTVFVSNNVPYIEALNDGHSKKAPAKFVEAAIFKGIRQTEEKFK